MSNKINNTMTSVAYMLGVSPEAVYAWTTSSEFEHIQSLEKANMNLTNTVHRLMSDRERIKNEISELFSKVKA